MGELPTIFVVDDDPAIRQAVTALLRQEGYHVATASTGLDAMAWLSAAPPPALVVLDVMLPERSGYEVCQRIQALPAPVPVLMLSARDELADRVYGLELGATDYLTKPFEPRELLARVRSLLRFRERASAADRAQPLLAGPLAMWPAEHRVEAGGQPLDLPPKEWLLLETLLRSPGMVLGRETLLRQVWGYDFAGDTRTVDVHIQRLRARLDIGGCGDMIQTVRGFGYRLTIPTAPHAAD